MFFFFNDSATTEFYTLSLHDALPISGSSHRLRLDPVGYLYAEVGAVAELLLDLEGLVRERERDVGYSGAAERVNLVEEKGERKTTPLNSSHSQIAYAPFCLKKKLSKA